MTSGRYPPRSPTAILVAVANPDRIWLVLARDVSHAVHVVGEPQIQAAMVLDVTTGLVRGTAMAASDPEAFAMAFAMALTKPAGHLSPGYPHRVLCSPGLAGPVAEALGTLASDTPLPPITEVAPETEAEDIFDSFVGYMAGRAQPAEFPDRDDWQLLFDQTLAYYRAEPWVRWSDHIDLALELTIADETALHVAVVMGNAGLQHGLVLYPGQDSPIGERDDHPWESMTPGTLICLLDPPGVTPAELTAKAFRYGWPPDAGLFPAFVDTGPGKGADPGRAAVQSLTVAIAAVLTHDARGPVLAHPTTKTTTGAVHLADGEQASFTIHQRP